MNRNEEILHQMIAVAWNNTFKRDPEMFQRLICNWTNSESGKSGNKARSMGVKKGISDWVWLAESGACIWIELKVGDNTQSRDQVIFQRLCERLGHQYVICGDFETF